MGVHLSEASGCSKYFYLFASYLFREPLLQKWNSYHVQCKIPFHKLRAIAEHFPLVASNTTILLRPLEIWLAATK